MRIPHAGNNQIISPCFRDGFIHSGKLFCGGLIAPQEIRFGELLSGKITAPAVFNLTGSAEGFLNALKRSHNFRAMGPIVRLHQLGIIRRGSAHQNLFILFRLQRQNRFPVAQQNHGFPGRLQRQAARLIRANTLRRIVEPDIRIIKNPHPELHIEHITNHLINRLLADQSLLNRLSQWIQKPFRLLKVRSHIVAGIHRADNRLFGIFCNRMTHVLKPNGATITHDIALKSIGIAQQLGEKILTTRDGFAIINRISAHDSKRIPLFKRFPEWLHIDFMHGAERNLAIAAHVIFPPVRSRINGIMLRGGNNSLILQAQDMLQTEFSNQIRTFTVTFTAPPPAGLLHHIQNRRIHITVAQRLSLQRRNLTDLIFQLAVKCGTAPRLNRKTGAVVMAQSPDALIRKIHRNTQPCFLNKPTLMRPDKLNVICRLGVFSAVRKIALFINIRNAVLPGCLFPRLGGIFIFQGTAPPVQGHHLPRLLIHRHLREQIVNAGVDVRLGILIDILAAVLIKIDPALMIDISGQAGRRHQEKCCNVCSQLSCHNTLYSNRSQNSYCSVKTLHVSPHARWRRDIIFLSCSSGNPTSHATFLLFSDPFPYGHITIFTRVN